MSPSGRRGYHESSEAALFLVRIADCSFDTWRAAALQGRQADVRAALTTLLALCARPEHALDDWSLRDDLRTVAHRFEMRATAARAQPQELIALIGITENAARALLVRRELPDEHFSVLYAQFAELVPLASVRST